MSFHVRITLTNVHKEASRSVIALGDTIFVDGTGQPQVVTAQIPKKYSVISYSLQDEEEQKPVKPAKAAPKPKPTKKAKAESSEDYGDESGGDSENSEEVIVQGRTGDSVIKSTRLRSKANEQ